MTTTLRHIHQLALQAQFDKESQLCVHGRVCVCVSMCVAVTGSLVLPV